MNDSTQGRANIAAVERETGLSKDTLRVWERRYGFPRPERDGNGDRLYPGEQVARLRLIKRLMDRGYRPGRLVAADEQSLARLAAGRDLVEGHDASVGVSGPPVLPPDGAVDQGLTRVDALFSCLRRHDVAGLKRTLSQCLAQEGLQTFVLDTVPQLNARVGEGWAQGQIEVFEEHLYTEQLQILLRQAIAGLPPGGQRPLVMLTTVPEEQHLLGILMLEALLTLHGVRCVSLGAQTPLTDIVAAVAAHRADVLALSFSAAFPSRQLAPLVAQLRERLPPHVGLWLGGAGVDKGFKKRLDQRGDPAAQGMAVCRALADVLVLIDQARRAMS